MVRHRSALALAATAVLALAATTSSSAEEDALAARLAAAQARSEAAQAAIAGVPWREATAERGYVHETEHYVVTCNVTPAWGARYAAFLEKVHRRYREVFGALPADRERGRNRVHVHRNQEEFTGTYGTSPSTGGSYFHARELLAAYHGGFGDSGNTFTVLAHEGAHQFQHRAILGSFLAKPIWVMEGLAVWLGEGLRPTRNGKVDPLDPPDRLIQLQQEYRRDDALSLATVIRTPQSEFASRFYAYAWAIVDFLVNPESPENEGRARRRGRSAFDAWWQEIVKGTPPPERFEAIIGSALGLDPPGFEAAVRAWILSRTAPTLGDIRGKTFHSNEFGFSIARPDRKGGWRFLRTDLRPGERIVVANTERSARVSVVAVSNTRGWDSIALMEQFRRRASERYDDFAWQDDMPRTTLAGGAEEDEYLAVETGFRGRERPNPYWTEAPSPRVQRIHLLGLATVDRLFVLRMQCDEDRWEESEAAMEAIRRSFRVEE